MNDLTKEKLKHRATSFLWRLAGMILVATLGFVVDSIGAFNLPPGVVVVIGLAVGEITKFINVNLPELRAEA